MSDKQKTWLQAEYDVKNAQKRLWIDWLQRELDESRGYDSDSVLVVTREQRNRKVYDTRLPLRRLRISQRGIWIRAKSVDPDVVLYNPHESSAS